MVSQAAGMTKNENDEEFKLLERILGEALVYPLFHPIVNLHTGDIFGHEVLSRGPEGTPLRGADALFAAARRGGLVWELERLCRAQAFTAISAANSTSLFFLNVNPEVLEDPRFRAGFNPDLLERERLDPSRIVIEITERSLVADPVTFFDLVRFYARQGFRIALDDTGAGYSGLNLLINVRPHFVKVDLELVRDVHLNGLKYNLLRFLADFTKASGLTMIAEGIETEDQLKSLVRLGVVYGQGYLFGRPGPFQQTLPGEMHNRVVEIGRQEAKRQYRNIRSLDVAAITMDHLTFPAEKKCLELDEFFRRNPEILGVPIVAETRPVGLVMRDSFYLRMGGRFGHGLFEEKPVAEIMDRQPLLIAADTPIEQASLLAMARPESSLYDPIIVENRHGGYGGVLTIKLLLQTTTDLEILHARYTNPLTGLPGNVVIERELNRVTDELPQYTVIFFDLNEFKSFNDVFGYTRGDEAIRHAADCLRRVFSQRRFNDPFIGHMGGDDFMVIVDTYEVEEALREFVGLFDEGLREFFSEEDFRRGHYVLAGRSGEETRVPLLFASLVVLSNESRDFADYREVAGLAASSRRRCKDYCRQHPGASHYLLDRRPARAAGPE